MKIISVISRIITGLVFIFSGFVKAIDPLGSTYKFIDYFNAFNLGFLESFAFPLAILLSSIELVLGISLLLGYKMRLTAWITLIFMSFFTILTFILALTNPVHDCGCFGDALILTNWQTFLKNIVLITFSLQIFLYRNKYNQIRTQFTESLVLGIFFAFSVGLSFFNLKHLPLIDFRPYKIGTHIPEAMIIPEGSPQNIYKTSLIYREISSGNEKEFDINNYPKDESLWEFVDAKSELVSKGFEPAIHDFNIESPAGQEITNEIINFTGYTFLLISYDVSKSSEKALQEANYFFQLSQTHKEIRFFAITSSSKEKTSLLIDSLNLEYDFCLADEITLKTMIRSNPGLILLHDGTILDKWSYADFPKNEDFSIFKNGISDYPFCVGCNLHQISEVPLGSKVDVYESVLFYKNLTDQSLQEFTIDNYPTNTSEWLFVDSQSKKISSGFKSILDRYTLKDYSGRNLSESIFLNPDFSLLFFIKDIYSIPSELFNKIAQLGAMSTEYLGPKLKVYAALDAEGDDLLTISDQFISSFEYLHLSTSNLNSLDFNSVMAVVIKDGLVLESYKDEQIPEPDELQYLNTSPSFVSASSFISPVIINSFRVQINKLIIICLIFGFFLTASSLRIFLNRNKK